VAAANGLANSTHAVIWQNGVPTDLGTLGTTAVAAAINNRSEVIGGFTLANGTDVHGFLWTRERGMNDIGTAGSDTSSFPTMLNNSRQIVGASCDSDMNCRAVLWERDSITDLNELIPKDSPLELVFASWINDVGEIVGQAVNKETGQMHAFLATPAGAPPAVSAAAAGVPARANVDKQLGATRGPRWPSIRRYRAR
jgi:probable HAF family extracellular repeat protein